MVKKVRTLLLFVLRSVFVLISTVFSVVVALVLTVLLLGTPDMASGVGYYGFVSHLIFGMFLLTLLVLTTLYLQFRWWDWCLAAAFFLDLVLYRPYDDYFTNIRNFASTAVLIPIALAPICAWFLQRCRAKTNLNRFLENQETT